jgi:hypothetical protein
MSKSSRDLRAALAIARKRHREAETAVLQEARREQDLDRIYSAARPVRASALPRTFYESRGQ